jgi:hypothetical protein
MMSPEHLERRCPRLGGDVAFGYCKACGKGKAPCWWERFDVVAYMKGCLSPDAFDALSASRPQPKVASLVELIRQARERASRE